MFRSIRSTVVNKYAKRFASSNIDKVVDVLNKYNHTIKLSPTEDFIKYAVSTILFPFGLITVPANKIVVIFRYGKYDGFVKPGLNWIHPFAVNEHEIYCGDRTFNFDKMKITDSNKTPITMSSYITYHVSDPVKFILNLQKIEVVKNQVESIFRENISKYSYNDLTSNNDTINNAIMKEMNQNDKIQMYGIEVVKTGILEINYSPEISEMMLVKQKATATLEARKEIIDVTLNLIQDVSTKLEDKLTKEDRSKLVTYLTVSMIGQNSPSNVINMN